MRPPTTPVQKRVAVQSASPDSIADDAALRPRNASHHDVAHPLPPPMPPLAPAAGEGTKMIAAPFARTLRYEAVGANVAMLSVPGRGHIYFGTTLSPPFGAAVAAVDAALAPSAVHTGMRELCANDDSIARRAVMWVLRGGRLTSTSHIALPEEVEQRLRVGFFDFTAGAPERVVPYSVKLHRRVIRLHRVLAERGGDMLGVHATHHGRYRFSLRRVTGMLTCTPDALATVICENHDVAACFSGKVSYATDVLDDYPALRRESSNGKSGLIFMTEGVPVGLWMRGRYRDTGFGLLCRAEDMYYRVVTHGDVSTLVRCRAGDIDYNTWAPKPVILGRVME